MVEQWNDFVDDAQDAAKDAAATPSGKAARQMTERVESAVADRAVNAFWRAAFVGASVAAMLTSVGFAMAKRRHEALLVGQWVPTLLITALWGQTVKRSALGALAAERVIRPIICRSIQRSNLKYRLFVLA